MKLKPGILRYWLAMNATALEAAIHALVLFCGVAGAHEATQWVPALNLQQLGWVFLIAFGRAILAYVEAHPVTDLLAMGAPPSGTARSSSPDTSAPCLEAGAPTQHRSPSEGNTL